MTNEEARKIDYDECPVKCAGLREECEKTCVGTCRQNLEAWGKLRSEIMAIGNWRNKSEISDNGVKDCLTIIDRHIAEIRR